MFENRKAFIRFKKILYKEYLVGLPGNKFLPVLEPVCGDSILYFNIMKRLLDLPYT